MSKDEPFQGIFSYVLYEDAYDADILQYATNSLFTTDGDFLLTDEGIASMEVDQDNNKVLVKIREGVKWSDGEPLKVEDLIQPYLIIGHKDYTGVRYDVDFQNIIGAVDYHDGKADTISGLKKVDETTLDRHQGLRGHRLLQFPRDLRQGHRSARIQDGAGRADQRVSPRARDQGGHDLPRGRRRAADPHQGQRRAAQEGRQGARPPRHGGEDRRCRRNDRFRRGRGRILDHRVDPARRLRHGEDQDPGGGRPAAVRAHAQDRPRDQDGFLRGRGARGGRQGDVELVAALGPDILLLDLRMPVLDGIGTIEALNSMGLSVKIIMLTTFDDDEAIHRAIGAGVAGYILKDCAPEELFSAIRAVHSGTSTFSPGVVRRLAGRREEQSAGLQKTAGDVAFLEAPEAGAEVTQGGDAGVIETIKTTVTLVSPAGGVISGN